jgi:beta-N-acetylhexosaminidase
MREVIRGSIGFAGLVMSDDLSMNALSGSLGERAAAAIEAGCDVALHCNGRLDEMQAVAAATPILAGKAWRRAENALGRIAHRPEPLDAVDAQARLDAALATAA